MRKESDTLVELIDYTRRLTKWYISKVPEEMLKPGVDIDDFPVNSAYWLTAHITWAQYSISRSIGAPKMDVQWLDEFRISSPKTPHQERWPDKDDLLKTMDDIHESTLTFVGELTSETLDEVHPNEALHYLFKTKRQAIFHIVRHEGYHTGQIGLIAKSSGADTV